MRTKRPQTSHQTKPVVRFYLAEDLRQEINGKITAVGVYADCVVILQAPADVPDPTEDRPLLIKSLGFLFNVSNIFEDTTISVDINRNGKLVPFVAPIEHKAPGPGRSLNLLGVMQPCPVTSFGNKELIVKIGSQKITIPFEIRRELLPSEPISSSSKVQKSKTTRQKKAKA